MPNGTFDPILIQNYIYVVEKIIELARNLTPEKAKKLDELLKLPLPQRYNDEIDMTRALEVVNLLFDKKDDKLQFLYTVTRR